MKISMLLLVQLVVLFGVTWAYSYKPFMKGKRTCGVDKVRPCKQSGALCETCDSLVVCSPQGDSFVKIQSAYCENENKCVTDHCTTEPNAICDGIACLEFICKATGMFPDPFFCNKFHVCIVDGSKKTHAAVDCSPGYSYNAKSTYCDTKMTDDECTEYPVPECKEAGDSSALAANPSIYYICEQYNTTSTWVYPYIFLCPTGQVYENFGCVDKSGTTTTEGSTTEGSTTGSTTGSTPVTTPTSTKKTPALSAF